MKTKSLLLFPLALTALFSCGGKSSFTYDDASKLAATYQEYIKNNKASDITVTGKINKVFIDGDATYWHASENNSNSVNASRGGGPKINNLLGMIPNFNIKNGTISIDKQDISKAVIPSSLLGLTDDISGNRQFIMVLMVLNNLPKFPMNANLLKLFDGIASLPNDAILDYYKDGKYVDWDKVQHQTWDNMTVTYDNKDGGLVATYDIPDVIQFVQGVSYRILGYRQTLEGINISAKATINTNSIGYITDLSLLFNCDNIKFNYNPEGGAMYANFDAKINLDFSLHFEQEKAIQSNLKYQVSEYEVTEDKTLKYVKSTSPTTDLNSLKDYFTVKWYHEDEDSETHYDDPVFGMSYWEERAKNIAFANEKYDVLLIPTNDLTADPFQQKNFILCYDYNYTTSDREPSLCSVVVNGQKISSANGIKNMDITKYGAADNRLVVKVNVGEEKVAKIHSSNLQILSTCISDNPDDEYIIDIAIIQNFSQASVNK